MANHKTERSTFSIYPSDKTKLKQLADWYETDMSSIIRMLIRSKHENSLRLFTKFKSYDEFIKSINYE